MRTFGKSRRSVDLIADFLADNDGRRTGSIELDAVREQIVALDRLTEAKFVTYRTLIDSQAEKVALALAAADKAVSKEEAATDKRLESMNEFRGALDDALTAAAAAAAHFVTREQLDDRLGGLSRERAARDEGVEQRLKLLETLQANMAGRMAIVGLVVTFVLSLVVVGANAVFR